jgi:phosphoribosylanthranilate isomerase
VDVSSGVESSPGLKSPEKIASFVSAARAAFQAASSAALGETAPSRAKERVP